MTPYTRTVYIRLSEGGNQIDGALHETAFETLHSAAKDTHIPLNFYRPKPYLTLNDWLKDMLVQVIEQL